MALVNPCHRNVASTSRNPRPTFASGTKAAETIATSAGPPLFWLAHNHSALLRRNAIGGLGPRVFLRAHI
jgi:hypothetical protein